MRPSPDFIIAGSAKSGTTALHYMLDQHPDIFMSGIKETNYFIHAFEDTRQMIDLRGRPVLEDQDDADIIDTSDKYAELFKKVVGNCCTGEASPWYLINPDVPRRIFDHRPDTRIIIILRNPADVAFANFTHHLRVASETLSPTESHQILNEDRYQGKSLQPLCNHLLLPHYKQHIQSWLQVFPREQLHFMIYEDFSADRLGHLLEVFSFLDLQPCEDINVDQRVNVSGMPRSAAVNRMIYGSKLAKRALGLFMSKKVRGLLRSRLESWNTSGKLEPDETLRRELDQRYSQDVLFVEQLMNRRIDAWHERRLV